MADPWDAAAERSANGAANPNLDFRSPEQRRADLELVAKFSEDNRRAEEAKLEAAKLKVQGGVPIPPPVAPMDAVTLEFAMASDTATVKLDYLVDPYLPAKCVVGFYGRGSTSKSSFLATISAYISTFASTLWVSVEEPADWIKVRHNGCGGAEKTLAIVTAVEKKRDAQGRVTGSSFNVYEHLETAIEKAKVACDVQHVPPRPLRLVVLDTVVGLTTWGKGESANDDGGVKRLLAHLQALAEAHDLTIAIIGHANKGKHDHFADVVMGASAWTNSPRLSFVHAKDEREDYAYVLRVAKTNLVTFGATYKTEPVHTLYERAHGPDSVLVRVAPGPTVWGEADSMELWQEATRKGGDSEEGGFDGGHKQSLVDTVIAELVAAVHEGGMPVTRDLVHARLGRDIGRREWKKVDERLAMGEFIYKVRLETGPHNKALYQKVLG